MYSSRFLISLLGAAFLASAQPAGTGLVTGTIFDAATGQPVRQAQVSIDGAADKRAVTDTDGRFRIEMPPGAYRVRITAPNYAETTVDDVVVNAGEVVEASTVMANKANVTTVDVVEKVGAVNATAEAALTERKLAPMVSDGLSNEELKATVGSDAAAAVEKVTGVSVVDGGYVYVRGLGERYSSTMLNNAVLPTTEPERRVVPLDLFPSTLIDNIRVLKTYSPDLPGEFSGGLVQMQTVEFPTQKTFTVGFSSGFNTQTTFNRFNSFPGGSRDWTGFGGPGGLPGGIPDNSRLFVGNYSPEQFQQFGRSFGNQWDFAPQDSMRPTYSYSMAGGNTWGRLGVVGALTWSNQPQRTPQLRRFLVTTGPGEAGLFSDYPTFNVDNQSVRLGGVMNAALRLNQSNKLVWRNTLTRDTDKEARFFSGLNGGNNNYIESTRLRWVERALISTGLEGEHSVAALGNSLFRWQFTYSHSTRNEPDLREIIYGRDPGAPNAPLEFLNLPESGLRFFSGLVDKIYEPQADWTKPFYSGRFTGLLKVGFRGTIRRRDFEGRRFRFFPVRAQTLDFSQPPDQLFAPANIRPDGFVVREITRGTDTYDASMDIFGGYAMIDVNLSRRLRLITGVRFEDADIQVRTIDPLVPGGIPSLANLSNRDPLPAANIIYQVTSRQNLRFGYARTVNRPDFRELSPFEFTNVVGGFSTVGNPALQRATIGNFDARWEWFPGGNQVLAASYFFKDFTDPIEQIYRPTASELRQSFINVAGARNQGIELEFRRNLGFLSRALRTFTTTSNFTFVDSNVQIPVERFPQLTSRHRPLVGQSRFIFNVITEWNDPRRRSNARFFVNSVSRRLTDVGAFGLPDVYQERNTFVDALYNLSLDEKGRWTLRFSAENLSNNQYKFSQAEYTVQQFRIGRTFSVGMGYSFF